MDSQATSFTPDVSLGNVPRPPSRLTLPVVLVGVGLVAMSISGTAIALPSIGRELAASGSALNWVVAGYNLAFAAMTLIAGAVADRAGRRRIFIIASVVFSGGFLATALAPSVIVVDIARVVSGIGGAGVMAAGGALLASSYEGGARNRAFAFMGTLAGVGIAVGPTVIGALMALTGWRGSFITFAVLGALIAGGAARLQETHAAHNRTDWLGSLLFVVTLSAFMFALLEAPEVGWAHPMTLLAFAVGVVALVLFAIAQRRSASPLLAPELVSDRGFMGWCLATLTTSIGFLGALVFLPTYLQAVAGQTPAAAGLTMLLLTAPVVVTPTLAVTLVNRGISARLLIMSALVLVVAGNFSLVVLGPENTTALVAVPLLLIGVGMGASFGITDGQAMALAPARLVGTAAGFLNTLRGAAEALVIAVFSASLIGFLADRLGDSSHAADVAAGNLDTTATSAHGAEVDAFTSSWHLTQIGVGSVCLLMSVVVALLLLVPSRGPRVNEDEDHLSMDSN
ncbi:MFS transporter [Knoellia remsis]|uniref:MFS transporter n=1 Tax=Knoellia remsis TaxID=407159 RepID=A0A2T0UZH4_9MICO|nr:MFS transporter [Knoellia remsis]PRY63311.1 MFS transporter [Knoellia remsis]